MLLGVGACSRTEEVPCRELLAPPECEQRRAMQVSVDHHVQVIDETGGLWSWGSNSCGELGTGNRDRPASQVPADLGHVQFDPIATIVRAGGGSTCVVAGGGARCFGAMNFGDVYSCLETDGAYCATEAPELPIDGVISDIALGHVSYYCAVVEGTITCGRGFPGYEYYLEARVVLQDDWQKVDIEELHACALADDGRVACWGDSDGIAGLGLGPSYDPEPQNLVEADPSSQVVELDAPAIDVCAGGDFSCAVLDDGRVRCWGGNAGGQSSGMIVPPDWGPYGDPIGDDEVPLDVPPVDVGAPATSIACGPATACVTVVGGGVRCWGGHEIVGYENLYDLETPVTPAELGDVDVGLPVTQVDVGSVTCAVTEVGTVRCWGDSGLDGYPDSIPGGTPADDGDVELFCAQ